MQIEYIVTLIFLVIGLGLAIIPSLPALASMFVVTLIYGAITKFSTLAGWEIFVLFVLVVLATLVDYGSGLLAAKYSGAHKKSLLYGIIGTLGGTVLLPPFGGFIGMFIGILAGEVLKHGDSQKAVKTATTSLLGSLIGQVIIVTLAVVYVVSFAILALK